MIEQPTKPVKNITVNYEDGTHDTLQFYSVVGMSGDNWLSILYSPPKTAYKVKMNNMLVELSNDLLVSIDKDL